MWRRAIAIGVLVLSVAPPAAARPEVTTNLAVQYGRRSEGPLREGLFGLDLHAALLGDRESERGFAAGGVVHVGVFDFAEAHLGAGATLLVPVVAGWPVVLEAFPVLAADAQGLRSGVAGRLSWGTHTFPRDGAYVVTAALFVEARWLAAGGGHAETVDLHVGVDLDAFALIWPWMFLWEAAFGD